MAFCPLQIREYAPYLVAEMPFTADGTMPTQSDRRGAFQSLAKYIFGGNKSSSKMAMTTPVISDDKTMRFVITDCEVLAFMLPEDHYMSA